MNTNIAILGGGSWGTAFAKVCAIAGYGIALFARDLAVVQEINLYHRNSRYLPGIRLPDTIRAYSLSDLSQSGDWIKIHDQLELLFIGVPAQQVRQCLQNLKAVPSDLPIISLAKGIERGSALRISEVIAEYYPHSSLGVLSGPNLALEVAANMPTTAVLAHNSLQMQSLASVETFTEKLERTHFSVQLSHDIIGVEIAAAMKNIIALACGMAAGLEFGENTLASLVMQGFREINRFIQIVGGEAKTLFSPAGIGDLTATCYAKSSRNHSFGMELGKRSLIASKQVQPQELSIRGETHNSADFPGYDTTIITHGVHQVVEAVPTLDALSSLAEKYQIETPFVDIMQKIMDDSLPIETGIRQLVALP